MVWEEHAVLATPWSTVGRRDMVQWAEDSRDSRCSAHPLSRRAAGAPHWGHSSTAEQPVVGRKDAGASPAGLVRRSARAGLRRARGAPPPRAGGTARDDRLTHAVVAQRTRAPGYEPGGREFESLRRCFDWIDRGWCKRIGTRGCEPLRAGSRPVPLIRHVPSAAVCRRSHSDTRRRRRVECRAMHPDASKSRSSVGRAADIPSPIPLSVSRAEGIEGYRI
jgi:hypothetical protein